MREVLKFIEEAFYTGSRSADVPFVVNDVVEVVAGPFSGRSGAVISIESVSPELQLFIEFGDSGGSSILSATDIRLLVEQN